MSFTIELAILALLGLGIVFGVANKMKGWKFAVITTGSALIVFAILYVAIIYAISSTM
jgi:hypothetical protein